MLDGTQHLLVSYKVHGELLARPTMKSQCERLARQLEANMADLSRLRQDWQTLLKPWAVATTSADRWFEDICKHYSESGDRLTTRSTISAAYWIWCEQTPGIRIDRPAVELAAWLHDVIYDSRASNNEEQSAAYASIFVPNWELAASERVAALILSTKTHDANGDRDAEVLLDADLAVLGSDELDVS